ncbi:MAG: outer membrane beta-barrel protein [Bacteroidetes bacterium]|nr:outer membrane beta-barrel protein [Bacteroidota bacterium]
MKNKIITILIFLISNCAFGQNAFKLGIKAGATSNERPYFCEGCERQIIFPTIGLTSYTNLNERFSIHTDLQLIRLGSQSRITSPKNNDLTRLAYRYFDKLEMPIYLKYRIQKTSKLNFNAIIGIAPNFFLDGRQLEKKSFDSDVLDLNPLKYSYDGTTNGIVSPMNKTSVQGQIGISIGMKEKLNIDAIYRFGEELTYAHRKSVPGIITGAHFQNNEFEISVSYWLKLN